MRQILLSLTLGFSITFIIGLILYPLLKRLKMGQPILSYVKEHSNKSGTPTMGGIMFITGMSVAYFIIMGFDSIYALITVAVTAAYGLIGFLDDFIKIKFHHNLGLRAYQKIIGQLLIAGTVAVFLYVSGLTEIRIPFTGLVFDIGYWSIPLIIAVMLSCTNSVNLTDGLDGLSSSVSIVYLAAFLILIYTAALSFNSSGIAVGGEFTSLSVLIAAAIGGITAFLAFNSYPAKLFMGDTGSMALGGLTAAVGVLTGYTLFIPIIGIMFVVSSLSVIIQVVSFKLRRKRVFLMAPFHHHLQQKGVSETRITVFYMLITAVVSALTVAFSL